MSYAKAMKHHNNPRKWKRTRVKDSRGMSLSGQRGQWLIFGKPITEAKELMTMNDNDQTVYDEDYKGPRWRYGMRNRPPGIAQQPKGRIIGADKDRTPDTDPRFRFGTIDYPRELTSEEIYDYELIFAEKIEGQVDRELVARVCNRWALGLAESRRVKDYLTGTQTSAEFDKLGARESAAVDDYCKAKEAA